MFFFTYDKLKIPGKILKVTKKLGNFSHDARQVTSQVLTGCHILVALFQN